MWLFGQLNLIDPDEAGLPETAASQGTLDTIIAQTYIAIGAIGFLLIVIAGLRYVASQGDPAKVTQAKNMVLYTLIGVVIAALAATIVRYVMGA